jgi:hypothetical protein
MAPAYKVYQARIAQDRKAAARERRLAAIAEDNARIERLYDDNEAFRRYALKKSMNKEIMPTELVVYPDLDLRWRG